MVISPAFPNLESNEVTTKNSFLITKSLKLGDSDNEVLILQKFLNSRTETKIANSGAGSPGNETFYFGQLTKAAVIKFQELYKDEILAPVGLIRGTGYFGEMSRKKANILLSGEKVYSATDPKPETILKPNLFSVSPASGKDGTTVILKGEGFLPTGNSVHAGYTILKDIPSSDGKTITFTVKDPFPDDLKFPAAVVGQVPNLELQYGFIVENKNGRSNTLLFVLKTSI